MRNFNYLFLLLLFSLCLVLQRVYALDKANNEQIHLLLTNNSVAADIDSLGKLYAENAVMFPPCTEIVEGRDGIEAYLDGLQKVGFKDYSMSTLDVDFKQGIAYETAVWKATHTDGNGNVIKLTSNISNVREKQTDGSWKITKQNWN